MYKENNASEGGIIRLNTQTKQDTSIRGKKTFTNLVHSYKERIDLTTSKCLEEN